MKYQNQVASKSIPWFMDREESEKRLPTLDQPVRKHAENMIRDGYTIIKGSIPKKTCGQLISMFKKLAAANPRKFGLFLDRDGHYPRIINLHVVLPELFELFSRNKIAYDVQEVLFGATPSLYTSLFYERGSAQTTHRDSPLFTTKPEYFYFGVWVALEDANEENGALEVIPGGHSIDEPDREAIALRYFPVLHGLPDSSNEMWDAYQEEVTLRCNDMGFTKKTLCVESGDTVIWHPQLPHGGSPIKNIAKSRFSFVMHTTPLGVPVYHMDKFFNPKGGASMNQDWEYAQSDECYYVKHDSVDFGHEKEFPVSAFTRARSRPTRLFSFLRG
jgi:phytanoyl-CoA hydroxylase